MFNSYGKIPYIIIGILTAWIFILQGNIIQLPNNQASTIDTKVEHDTQSIEQEFYNRYYVPPPPPTTIHVFKNDRVMPWLLEYGYGFISTIRLDPIPSKKIWGDLPPSKWAYLPSSRGYGPTCNGLNEDNIYIVNNVAKRYGWDKGPNWDALVYVINHEGAWCETAQNPTSSAYGIGQFLDSTWGLVGIQKTSDPYLQAEAIMRYISLARYKNPLNAYYFKLETGIY